ncbi:MAG TPA: RsmB/NOP family class I SAM-dependent RNA methyltransferase [Caulobacteraceae bacterium]|nr:RsmB/NOP family class I SAM-dependent RNA methyltransferase [Caulobacteraceae bacterium]
MTFSSPDDPANDLAARDAALSLASAALDRRGGLEQALEQKPFSTLEPRDRAFARMLAMTLLRRLGAIDSRLQARLAKEPPEPVVMLLRLGLVQALYLDTPDFAAVDTTVRLAERDKTTRPFKGLINGVLRSILREPPHKDDPEALVPGWLYARWHAAYGEADARAIAAVVPFEPATDLTPRDPTEAAELAALLEAEVLPGPSLRVSQHGDVASWSGYHEGRWWVQDAAAAIPARLLQLQARETVLDLCAAPGGKTLEMAAAGAKVAALDRSEPRLARLRQALHRTGLAAEIVTADAASWGDPRRFAAVLLDAPCSATGTFRRHPDVLWGSKPGDIASLAGVQARLLDAAADRVEPGGRLVYCVCSLEPEEGEAQMEGLLKRRPDLSLWPIAPGEGGSPEASVTPAGTLRILPHHRQGALDGFFVARFRKA